MTSNEGSSFSWFGVLSVFLMIAVGFAFYHFWSSKGTGLKLNRLFKRRIEEYERPFL
jgi:hypothetical protein